MHAVHSTNAKRPGDVTPESAEAVDGPIGSNDGALTARKGINPLEVAQISSPFASFGALLYVITQSAL